MVVSEVGKIHRERKLYLNLLSKAGREKILSSGPLGDEME